MATIIIIFIILAGYHFVTEGIIIPVLMNELRHKLIKLRDRLFMLRIKQPDKIDKETHEKLNITICIVANHLDKFEIADVLRNIKKIKKDMRENKSSNVLLIDGINNQNDEVKYIHKKTGDYLFRAFLFNSLGWSLYLFPFIILFSIILLIISFFNHFILKEIKKYFYIAKEKEMTSLMQKHETCKEIIIDGNHPSHIHRLSKNGIGRKLHRVN